MSGFLVHGGLFAYLPLLMGLVTLVTAVVQAIGARKLDLRPLMRAELLIIVALGFLGALLGIIQAFEAVAKASPEIKQVLLAQGISVALISMASGLMALIPSAGFVGIAASIRASVAPGPDASEG